MIDTTIITGPMYAQEYHYDGGNAGMLRVAESSGRLRASEMAAMMRAVPLGSARSVIHSWYEASYGGLNGRTRPHAYGERVLRRVDDRWISVWQHIAVLCRKIRVYWEAYPIDLLETITVDNMFETMRMQVVESHGLGAVDVFYDADGNYAGFFAFSLTETAPNPNGEYQE